MKIINKRFQIIEKKKDFDSFSLYLAKDNKDNQLYYLLFQIQNNLIINNFNSFIEYIINQKKSLNPAIINPVDFYYINFIDDVLIDSPTFFLIYPYEDRILLDEFLEKSKQLKEDIFKKIMIVDSWIKFSEEGKFKFNNSIILVDKNLRPYFIPVFPYNKINNTAILSNIENPKFIDYNFIFSYFKDSNSLFNYMFHLPAYILNEKLNIIKDSFDQPSYEKPLFYNFINFSSSFISYCEDYLSIISKKGFFNFLTFNASPDKNSIILDANDKLMEKYYDEVQFLHLKADFLSKDISRIKHAIMEFFYLISMKKSVIVQINNFNVADTESIKFLNSLHQIKNLHYPLIFIIFDFKNKNLLDYKINTISFSEDIEIQNYLKNTIINSYSKLLYIDKEDTEFLKNLELPFIISILSANPSNIFIFNDSKITLKRDFIQNSIQNEIDIVISNILNDEKNREFFSYFAFFEKPTNIRYLLDLFGDNVYSIINKYIKDKFLYIDEKNRINSNLISTMKIIFQHIVKDKIDKKVIIEKITDIYLRYIDDLELNEVFLCFQYLCELEDFTKAAFLIDNKLLLPLISNKKIIKNIFFSFLQSQFNFGKDIDKIDDIYSRFILRLFYYKLKYLDNYRKLEPIIQQLYQSSLNYDFHYRFAIEKLLYYINIHNTEKIEKDINLIEKNFDKLSDKLKKLFLYARAEDYFSRYDHNNSIKTAKQAIRILCLDNNFDKSLYLPLLHRMSYSIIYSCDYKKAASYLKYFLMKAEQLKDIKYIFHSYNNLGVVNYRNKEFEKARKYMINALEYARQLEDKTLLFVSYNNLNLLEMDKKIRLQRSRKMLKLAPFLAEKTYLILSFCNIFLYLLEEGNFEEIFNIVSKYKDEIFQNFENYSFFTIRRFLHLYTILTFPFYIFEKKEYLNLFYKNLCTVKDKIEYQDEKSELKYLYNLIKPIIYYLINNESLENKSLTELKDKIKDIFIEYTEDKDKIVNTEFFTSLLGIYGLLFFEKSEYLNLIKELVKKYGKDSKVCNSDLSIFYRINTNNRYTDQTLMRYISIYFKLNDIEPWSSSGIFFKIYIFLFYLQILKNTKNIEKLKLYLQIFYRQFNPFLEFINTEFLFFPYIKENFSQMINLIEKINKSDKKRGENFSDYSISSFKNISLPKDGYDKDYFISLLSELTNHFGFDRGMLYLYENKEIRLKESICKQPILYHNFEPSYNFMENDYFYPQQPLFKKIKNSNISEILYLPIYFVNAIQRIASLEKYDKKNLQGVMLRGYFYFDSKTIKNRKLQYQTIQFCALYLSELFERIQLEKIYMNDYLTRVLTRENFFKKCYQVLNINKKSTIFAILMIDIDNFKKVNDNFGHQKGDIVLSKVAQTIKNSLRNIDIVGRYGGEEFTVCLMDTSMDNATIVAERIRTNIENLEFFDSNIKITVSIGLSFFPEDGMVIDELINKADIAMYRAKNKGKNRVEIYSN